MIRFLIKGLIRDRNRSLFPILTVTVGVSLTVLIHCWVTGIFSDMIDINARFSTGHVKIMTQTYLENIDQSPNDLALMNEDEVISESGELFPDMNFTSRIRFGGLLDAPDENGETKSQGTVMGWGIDLFSPDSRETERMNINTSLIEGKIPEKSGEILISREFADNLEVGIGDAVTLISSTMYGSMAMQNFTITGMVEFGMSAMDRGAIIMDLADAQIVLDMIDATSEIVGYFNNGIYEDEAAQLVVKEYNAMFLDVKDEFSPIMQSLRQQNQLDAMLSYSEAMIGIIVFIFVLAMSIVLWNAGLLGGIRRYGEYGLRLAIGENKGHVFRSMLSESVAIGIAGSFIGSIIGLAFALYLQVYGFDVSQFAQKSTMMIPNVYRAHITPVAYYIGFIPGLFSTVLGTALSGIGIYRRKTAQLFKELET
jgi:putative ABC transport system permease protein